MDFKVDGSAGRRRPRKSWLECVNDDMKKFGLKKEMAHDRSRSVGYSWKRLKCASMENVTLNGQIELFFKLTPQLLPQLAS